MSISSTSPVADPLVSLGSLTGTNSGSSTPSSATSSAAGTASAFLTLLVTQMQNQDPLNPMDNAQITSQIAQINTVNGIQQLNTSVTGLSTQFTQMQALQGAALVGHDITIDGNQLTIAGGNGTGGFSLPSNASDVQVQVLDTSGTVVNTMDLGAQTAGNHSFTWPATNVADGSAYTFKVTATSGGTAVTATPLMQDTVQSVTTGANGLVLQTAKSGNVALSAVVAFD